MRQAGALPVQPLAQGAAGDLIGAHPGGHRHAGVVQACRTTGGVGVRVSDGIGDRRDAGVEQGLDTGRGATVMVARLQCHHCGAAGRALPRGPQGNNLGMRTTRRFGGAYPDNLPVRAHDHRSDGRIRIGGSLHPLGLFDRLAHRGDDLRGRGHRTRCGDALPAWWRNASTATAGSAAP